MPLAVRSVGLVARAVWREIRATASGTTTSAGRRARDRVALLALAVALIELVGS